MSRLNVLALHQMGEPKYWREAVRSLEFMIQDCRSDLNCLVHDCAYPFPDYLQDLDFHLVVLGPTFLCNRYREENLAKTLQNFRFLVQTKACKVALPQDDYDCSAILDDWLHDWSVDRIYTVCPDQWEILYPTCTQKTQIMLGYTGYVSEEWIETWKLPKPHGKREIDVSYRATKLPANFGSLGQLKYEIAGSLVKAIKNNPRIKTDISVRFEDMIPGKRWHEFMNNSRCCLATPSGSSLLDPRNEIRKCVEGYVTHNPQASFREIEEHCFPGEDKRHIFSAISPRNIEAALAETVQLATPGDYSGLMKPDQDCVLLREDCSNIKEVLKLIQDPQKCKTIARRSKEKILSEPRLRRANIVQEIVDFGARIASERRIPDANQNKVDKAFRKYQKDKETNFQAFSSKKGIRYFFKKIFKRRKV